MKLDGPNGHFYYGDRQADRRDPDEVAEYAAAPTVVGTSPAGGATNVALSGPFTIDFSEPMEAVTVAGGISLAPAAGGPAVPVTVATLDPTTFGITPNAPLAQGTQYKLSVGAAAKDIQGTGATAHEVTFTTSGTPTNTTPTNTTPTNTTPTNTTPTTSTPTQTTQTTPTTPKPVVKPAYCKRYPKLRTTLARQLKAAKKARVKAVDPQGQGQVRQADQDDHEAAEGGHQEVQGDLPGRHRREEVAPPCPLRPALAPGGGARGT